MSDQTNAPTGDGAGRVNMSGGLTSGPKIQNMTEVLAIVSVAIVIKPIEHNSIKPSHLASFSHDYLTKGM